MEKLKLDLDDLQVESFSTDSEETAKGGTVKGYAPYTWQDIPECHQTDGSFCTDTHENNPNCYTHDQVCATDFDPECY